MKVRELIDKLNEMDKEDDIAVAIWSIDDVFAMAEEEDINLTKQQASEILDCLMKTHDASIGINWEVITTVIEDYIEANHA